MKYLLKILTIILLLCYSQTSWGQSYSDNIDFKTYSIHFENGSDAVLSKYAPILYRLAEFLKKNPNTKLIIRGHVCCVNKNVLAKKRAKSVEDYLLRFGVNEEQLITKGMKNTIPLVSPEVTFEDKLANMRVDFVIQEKSPAN